MYADYMSSIWKLRFGHLINRTFVDADDHREYLIQSIEWDSHNRCPVVISKPIEPLSAITCSLNKDNRTSAEIPQGLSLDYVIECMKHFPTISSEHKRTLPKYELTPHDKGAELPANLELVNKRLWTILEDNLVKATTCSDLSDASSKTTLGISIRYITSILENESEDIVSVLDYPLSLNPTTVTALAPPSSSSSSSSDSSSSSSSPGRLLPEVSRGMNLRLGFKRLLMLIYRLLDPQDDQVVELQVALRYFAANTQSILSSLGQFLDGNTKETSSNHGVHSSQGTQQPSSLASRSVASLPPFLKPADDDFGFPGSNLALDPSKPRF